MSDIPYQPSDRLRLLLEKELVPKHLNVKSRGSMKMQWLASERLTNKKAINSESTGYGKSASSGTRHSSNKLTNPNTKISPFLALEAIMRQYQLCLGQTSGNRRLEKAIPKKKLTVGVLRHMTDYDQDEHGQATISPISVVESRRILGGTIKLESLGSLKVIPSQTTGTTAPALTHSDDYLSALLPSISPSNYKQSTSPSLIRRRIKTQLDNHRFDEYQPSKLKLANQFQQLIRKQLKVVNKSYK